jgi:hypothetical protein
MTFRPVPNLARLSVVLAAATCNSIANAICRSNNGQHPPINSATLDNNGLIHT